MGKHGNLEWLPGKALALGEACFPEAVFGPLPHLYPFIVNDPGEGSQAKRRAQAVIVDHLTPPLTRAETYGPLAELELLVDEYFEAAGVDPRRLRLLPRGDPGAGRPRRPGPGLRHRGRGRPRRRALQAGRPSVRAEGDADPRRPARVRPRAAGNAADRPPGVDGPAAARRHRARRRLAHARARRRSGSGGLRSAVRESGGSLARTPPRGARRAVAGGRGAPAATPSNGWSSWPDCSSRARSNPGPAGRAPARCWTSSSTTCGRGSSPRVRPSSTRAVMPSTRSSCRRAPRARPTRGRLDVPAHGPELLLGRHPHGADPGRLEARLEVGVAPAGALSAGARGPGRSASHSPRGAPRTCGPAATTSRRLWSLMGVKPAWEVASRRVTGFEVLPLDLLDRPRVDVTLRISGFFRDAFPSQIDLFDSAARAVAALDEPERSNPLAASTRAEAARLVAAGVDGATAARRAGFRVFGSKPGAYGAGPASVDRRARLGRPRPTSPAPTSPGEATPTAPARTGRPSTDCSRPGWPACRRCSTTRTTGNTTCSTPTTTTSSRGG